MNSKRKQILTIFFSPHFALKYCNKSVSYDLQQNTLDIFFYQGNKIKKNSKKVHPPPPPLNSMAIKKPALPYGAGGGSECFGPIRYFLRLLLSTNILRLFKDFFPVFMWMKMFLSSENEDLVLLSDMEPRILKNNYLL